MRILMLFVLVASPFASSARAASRVEQLGNEVKILQSQLADFKSKHPEDYLSDDDLQLQNALEDSLSVNKERLRAALAEQAKQTRAKSSIENAAVEKDLENAKQAIAAAEKRETQTMSGLAKAREYLENAERQLGAFKKAHSSGALTKQEQDQQGELAFNLDRYKRDLGKIISEKKSAQYEIAYKKDLIKYLHKKLDHADDAPSTGTMACELKDQNTISFNGEEYKKIGYGSVMQSAGSPAKIKPAHQPPKEDGDEENRAAGAEDAY